MTDARAQRPGDGLAGGTAVDDAGPDDAGPDDAGPDDAGPDGAGPDGAGPDGAGPDDAGPDDAGPDDAGPDDAAQAVRLATVIGQLVRLLRRRSPAQVGPGSLGALATLARCGPMRLGDLASREGVAPPTLTRMIAVMEEGGLVSRRPDEHDRRAVRVSVTAAGAQVVAGIGAARAAVLRDRLAQLSPQDRQELAAALPALEAVADDSR
jgi:DNA-binding MarR family transcriptional regulator